MNKMKEREAFSQGLLSQHEHTYLQNASGIRTVAKRHNSTNYLFCEHCIKGSTKHGEIPVPMEKKTLGINMLPISSSVLWILTTRSDKGDKPNVKEVYDYQYEKDFDPVENAVYCCVQLLEVFPEPVTCCTPDQFCNNQLLYRERNTGASSASIFPFDQEMIVRSTYDDVIAYLEQPVYNHELNLMTPLPGHPIDNAIPNYPFDNWRKIDIPAVKVGEVFPSRDAIRDYCERVFDAEASIAFWMMNVYEFGNQFYSDHEMGCNHWPRKKCDAHITFSGVRFPFLGNAHRGMPTVHQWCHQDIVHWDHDYPKQLEQDGASQPCTSIVSLQQSQPRSVFYGDPYHMYIQE
jgi:hypothetical protein